MNAQKSVAVVCATLITVAGVIGIANYSNAAASSQRIINASAPTRVVTLPTITVTPVPAASSANAASSNPQANAGAAPQADAAMPYYSFAADQAGA